jgi:hypothetical protein
MGCAPLVRRPDSWFHQSNRAASGVAEAGYQWVTPDGNRGFVAESSGLQETTTRSTIGMARSFRCFRRSDGTRRRLSTAR